MLQSMGSQGVEWLNNSNKLLFPLWGESSYPAEWETDLSMCHVNRIVKQSKTLWAFPGQKPPPAMSSACLLSVEQL